MIDKYSFYVKDVDFVVNRECTNSWTCHPQRMTGFVLAINLKGKCYYQIDGNNYEVNPNDVMMFPPGTLRLCAADEINPWHFISVSFSLSKFNGDEYAFSGDIPLITRNVHSQVTSNFKRLSNVWNTKPKAYYTLCRTIIQDMLCQLIQINDVIVHNPAHYSKIETVKQYINNNYTKPITVEELSKMVGLSPSHFRKIFREIVGMSATQYAIYMRINKAKDLLMSGEANVSEAAFQSGFKDVFYFSTLFKKVTGDNPSKYIK